MIKTLSRPQLAAVSTVLGVAVATATIFALANFRSAPGCCAETDEPRLQRKDFELEGIVVETDEFVYVNGTVSVMLPSGDTLRFLNASVVIEYDIEGYLVNFDGEGRLETSIAWLELQASIRYDIGVYPGRVLNHERDYLPFLVIDRRLYFVFYEHTQMSARLGDLEISSPVDHEMAFVLDVFDPMAYFSFESPLMPPYMPRFCLGHSDSRLMRYVPRVPLHTTTGFPCSQVQCVPSLPIAPLTWLSGVKMWDELDGQESNVGYNGEIFFDLSVSIVTLIRLDLGEASAAHTVTRHSRNADDAVLEFRGYITPDSVFSPSSGVLAPLSGTGGFAYGTVANGTFDITAEAPFIVQGTTVVFNASITMQPDLLQAVGTATILGDHWDANMTWLPDYIEFLATWPPLADPAAEARRGCDHVLGQLDAARQDLNNAQEELQQAQDYLAVEMSLQGIRDALPALITDARSRLSSAIAAEKARARTKRDQHLSANNHRLCSDNINSAINGAAAPVTSALNALEATINADDDTFRAGIHDALSDVRAVKVLETSVTVTVTSQSNVFVISSCSVPAPVTSRITASIQRTILSDQEASDLDMAIGYAQAIPAANDRVISAEEVLMMLPLEQHIIDAEDSLQSCTQAVAEIPTSGVVSGTGLCYRRSTAESVSFVIFNGNKLLVGEDYDMASVSNFGSALISYLNDPEPEYIDCATYWV